MSSGRWWNSFWILLIVFLVYTPTSTVIFFGLFLSFHFLLKIYDKWLDKDKKISEKVPLESYAMIIFERNLGSSASSIPSRYLKKDSIPNPH